MRTCTFCEGDDRGGITANEAYFCPTCIRLAYGIVGPEHGGTGEDLRVSLHMGTILDMVQTLRGSLGRDPRLVAADAVARITFLEGEVERLGREGRG